MRPHLAAILVIWAGSSAIGAEMSKDQCMPMVDGAKAISDQIKRIETTFGRLEMKKNTDLTQGEILDSAQRMEKARQQTLTSLKEYQVAADDLTQRLHDCAGMVRDTGRAQTPTDGKTMAPLFPKPSAPK